MLPRRPVGYWLVDQPCVMVPAQVAAWLEEQTTLPQRRIQLRGVDPAIDEVLLAIRQAAMSHSPADGSGPGTSLASVPEPAAVSDVFGVAAAAGLLGITGRAVRKAITENRLPATRVDGRWLINRHDALNFKRPAA